MLYLVNTVGENSNTRLRTHIPKPKNQHVGKSKSTERI